uniref:Uncharacterized protein n=1 Tax=Oryza meridionalis TaxID=40149 RepID=A0A0E0DED2_9ORYZ
MPCQIVGQVHPRGCVPLLSAAFSSRQLRILPPWPAKEAEVTGKERHVKELAILMFIESFDLGRQLKMLGKKKRGRPSSRLVGAWVASACLTSRRKQGGTP